MQGCPASGIPQMRVRPFLRCGVFLQIATRIVQTATRRRVPRPTTQATVGAVGKGKKVARTWSNHAEVGPGAVSRPASTMPVALRGHL